MNRSKHGLKVLGLSLLAALGMMAFAAAGAQGSGEWLIEGKTLKELGVAKETIVGEVENALTGGLLILNLNLRITCHEGSISGYILPLGHGHLAIELKNCLVLDKNEKIIACDLNEPIKDNFLTLVILHNVKPYILLSALDGLTVKTISHADELCPLPETASVKCNVVAKISNPDQDNNPLLILTQGMLELFPGDKCVYGTNTMHIDLQATLGLSGKYAGRSWGAV